jgi:hypothetical protein
LAAAGSNPHVLSLKDEIPMQGLVLVARKDLVAKDKSGYTKVVGLVGDGYTQLVNSAPDYTQALGLLKAKVPNLDPKVAKASIGGDVEDYLAGTDSVDVHNSADAWNQALSTMKEGNFLGDKLPPADDMFVVL